MKFLKSSMLILVVLLLIDCRGGHSTKPPIHLNPNMDSQDKFKTQSVNTFFADSSAMRMPVEGTIAQNANFDDTELLSGKTPNGNFVNNPFATSEELLNRGKNRFDIYCAVCHGTKADGTGNITKYKYPIPPTNFHQDWLIAKQDGYYFDVISNGIRTMSSYQYQIPPEDRWAIIAHIRKLQESN